MIENQHLVACKLFERRTELKQSLEVWGFRFHDLHEQDPAVRRLIVYNPDIGRWDDNALSLAAGICDDFIPFNDGDRLLRCLRTGAA